MLKSVLLLLSFWVIFSFSQLKLVIIHYKILGMLHYWEIYTVGGTSIENYTYRCNIGMYVDDCSILNLGWHCMRMLIAWMQVHWPSCSHHAFWGLTRLYQPRILCTTLAVRRNALRPLWQNNSVRFDPHLLTLTHWIQHVTQLRTGFHHYVAQRYSLNAVGFKNKLI
jgi:hypothetical protein